MVSFQREILESLRSKNPDLLGAYVCLGLAAGADGVAAMTAPGPLTHIKHKRRAGMISALVAAGLLKRAASGYLVHGVSSEATDDGQTENTAPTAARETSRCNTSRNNSEGTDSGQAGGSEALTDAFIDITDPDEIEGMAALESLLDSLPAEPQRQAPVIGMGLRRPPAAISPAPAPEADNEAHVEARAREMALEAWDGADARTFQTCDGEFEQFWTYRKRHFMDQARQKLAAS